VTGALDFLLTPVVLLGARGSEAAFLWISVAGLAALLRAGWAVRMNRFSFPPHLTLSACLDVATAVFVAGVVWAIGPGDDCVLRIEALAYVAAGWFSREIARVGMRVADTLGDDPLAVLRWLTDRLLRKGGSDE